MGFQTDRRDLLKNWLRNKGFYPADVVSALTWYDEQVTNGRKPNDDEVLAIADQLHESILQENKQQVRPIPLIIRYEITWKIVLGAMGGSVSGWLLIEGIRWLVLAAMP